MPFKITNFTTSVLEESHFIKPVKITYTQNGISKNWEGVKSFDSVAVLLYHKEENAFLLVKQFRPPVYMVNHQITYTYELCAGIIDKDLTLEEIAKEEIDEECGYDVPLENIEKITSFYTNVGVSGARQHLYFAQIDESMKVHDGGGIHDEEIILEFVEMERAKDLIYDEAKAKTPGLMFAFYWFFENKS